MSLIWGVWFGFGMSGGYAKPPIPRGSAVLSADIYGGIMWARLLTLQLSLYPNVQTAGSCLDNWIRGKASILLGNHELGVMVSPLCILNTGEYSVYRDGYVERYEYRTGGKTYGVGAFYNVRLAFIRAVRTYVGVDFLYPIRPGTVPIKGGESPAPHISYPTFGFHVGWTWGRRVIP